MVRLHTGGKMNRLKTYVWRFAVLAGLCLAGSLLESKMSRAQAIYSTPVSVMNTTANPAIIIDAERNARIPYESHATVNCGVGTSICQFNFTYPPAGYRLVVQNITGYLRMGSTDLPWVRFQPIGQNDLIGITSVVMENGVAAINQNLLTYLDTGYTPAVSAYGTFGTSFDSNMTLIGYLENCSITGCPAIVH
jgi:hypothetical protein